MYKKSWQIYFGGGDNEILKVVKLKKVEQENKTIKKFV